MEPVCIQRTLLSVRIRIREGICPSSLDLVPELPRAWSIVRLLSLMRPMSTTQVSAYSTSNVWSQHQSAQAGAVDGYLCAESVSILMHTILAFAELAFSPTDVGIWETHSGTARCVCKTRQGCTGTTKMILTCCRPKEAGSPITFSPYNKTAWLEGVACRYAAFSR